MKLLVSRYVFQYLTGMISGCLVIIHTWDTWYLTIYCFVRELSRIASTFCHAWRNFACLFNRGRGSFIILNFSILLRSAGQRKVAVFLISQLCNYYYTFNFMKTDSNAWKKQKKAIKTCWKHKSGSSILKWRCYRMLNFHYYMCPPLYKLEETFVWRVNYNLPSWSITSQVL